uniref:Immunoglobulin domain-containing protein n=1 Tax=Oryzias latipes TaxID=8090 RepID=A0A3P9JTZ1_ORYLA
MDTLRPSFESSSLMDRITQTPAHVFKHAGEKAEIKCSHSIQSYNNGLWYKQSEDGQMQLLGYMISGSAFPESGPEVTMGGSADKDQTFTLTIAGISESSRAVYFCAAQCSKNVSFGFFGCGKTTVVNFRKLTCEWI